MYWLWLSAVLLGNFGRHEEFLTPQKLVSFFKCLYVVQILHSVSIGLIKFSILLFFRRIFRIPKTRIPVIVLAAVIAAWLVATVCHPWYKRWSWLTCAHRFSVASFHATLSVVSGTKHCALNVLTLSNFLSLSLFPTLELILYCLSSQFPWYGICTYDSRRKSPSWHCLRLEDCMFRRVASRDTTDQLTYIHSIIVVSTLRLVSVVHALGDPDITCKPALSRFWPAFSLIVIRRLATFGNLERCQKQCCNRSRLPHKHGTIASIPARSKSQACEHRYRV